MKRFFCLIIIFLIITAVPCSCNNGTAINVSTEPPSESSAECLNTEVPTELPVVTPYIPVITPDKVNIYIPAENGTSARKMITEFRADRVAKTDIDCFEVFASDSALIEGGSFADMWKKSWDNYGENPESKIGFKIEFCLSDGKMFSKIILKPSDANEFYDFLEVYIYDDINQNGGWYSHLEDDDINDKTIMSSIKLTSGSRIDEVGNIKLSAFIYNGTDNFNSQGEYIGKVISDIVIYK